MKTKTSKIKHILLIIGVFAILFLFNSCGNKNSPTSSESNNFYFKVKIDGIEHSFNKMVFVNASLLKLGIIAISTTDGNGNNIQIAIASSNPERLTGTITDDFTGSFFNKSQPGLVWDADGKTRIITITENNDAYIEGTFSFIGNDRKSDITKEFTEGTFRARKPKKKK
ncbi:hypothetical protein [Maribacter sp. ACAM166]|uniref:hypothetical protein n=1 Tax=Maribacter sp. ACAM166 TaxID=2508996 RepID=UPI0010FF4290|nr:hypothetical protein [Maribacter sp. ACAM166]TLP74277.1 hypothetical protein ES765_16425 [Maribacter sp. ACAM166]